MILKFYLYSLDETTEDDDGEEVFEDDVEYLKKVDIKDKKKQDCYRILGLSKQRINATDDQIKKAHRQKVLRHHPDKRKAAGETVKEDDYFSCITTAFETLINPERRKAFDSVDPTFDDGVPNVIKQETLTPEEEIKQKVLKRLKEKRKSAGGGIKRKSGGGDKRKSKGGDKKVVETEEEKSKDFFEVFGPVFERNSRWAIKTPVPQLGNLETAHEGVILYFRKCD